MAQVNDTSEKIGMLLANVQALMQTQIEAKDDRDKLGIMMGTVQMQLSEAHHEMRDMKEKIAELKDELDLLKPLRDRMTRWAFVSAGVGFTISGLAMFFGQQMAIAKERLIAFLFG